jgi:hypothetical protein
LIKNPIPNANIFKAHSVGGSTTITHHAILNLLDPSIPSLTFFLLPNLSSFDGIIGHDSLKELNAVIHTKEGYMEINNKIKIPISQLDLSSENKPIDHVNTIELRTSHLTESQKQRLSALIDDHPSLFADPNEKLTYTSVVKAQIRTTTDEPVFTKSYPYPMALKDEVERQIGELLDNGIIRPSRSPYNSPVWIVDKKEDASGKKKYRLVIDYRKLNKITIPDRYPIPEINEVLANLGKNKIFSVLDLKSGFHQIPLCEKDIEKTAFSINNGKYEYTRLPFGLKNAPSIFQRTLDDILRQHIGSRCYVYIDDIIIFGKDEEEHFVNLKLIFSTLEAANMKVQLDKCEFLRNEVEFLGFIVSDEGIKSNPKKTEVIKNIPPPKNLKDLRSFLGMTSYYRRFIPNYAEIAKPLTGLLRGEGGRVSKTQSKNIPVTLNKDAEEAFQKIKNCLVSDQVILTYPDFEKPFELHTDASDYAIGAVLSQEKRPITFLSRTLTKTEENYATNEKELLAIVWALNSLRNYLYGSKKVIIHTDHQPLTNALSPRNNNNKLKRWKNTIEEHNYELNYKAGINNQVADALSRIIPGVQIHIISTSSNSSLQDHIHLIKGPINAFKNQIILNIGNEDSYNFIEPFPKHIRHTITRKNFTENTLIQILKNHLNPNVINAIKAERNIMEIIQVIYPLHLQNYKIKFTNTLLEDITNEFKELDLIAMTHRRAHRNPVENKAQLIQKYYFPRMMSKIKNFVKKCTICKENKYDRHPPKPQLQETPIPEFPGHTLYIDIYSTESKLVLTAICKLTKFAQAKIIKSRSGEHVKQPLSDILFYYGIPECVVIDNEKSLNSAAIRGMMEDQLKIKIFVTPPYKSEVNGQVERFHSTLTEIMRCLKAEGACDDFESLLQRAVNEYNHTIHSVTRKKPIELFLGRIPNITPEAMEEIRRENVKNLKNQQAKDLDYHNRNRKPIKSYNVGEAIYVKHNKRLGSKLTFRYKKEIVREDRNTTVLTNSGKIIHKSNIKS